MHLHWIYGWQSSLWASTRGHSRKNDVLKCHFKMPSSQRSHIFKLLFCTTQHNASRGNGIEKVLTQDTTFGLISKLFFSNINTHLALADRQSAFKPICIHIYGLPLKRTKCEINFGPTTKKFLQVKSTTYCNCLFVKKIYCWPWQETK